MTTYNVTDPTTNKSVSLEGDSPPTEQELNDIFSQVHGTPSQQQPQQENFTGNLTSDVLKNAPSALWSSVKSLEPMARQGLNAISNAIPQPNPTGNLPLDILKGTPSILGKSTAETASKTTPGFVSPLSLGMMGAGYAAQGASKIPLLQKVASGTGEALASGLQKVTGIPAENTMAAFSKPLSMFKAPYQSEVSSAYNASELPEGAKDLTQTIEEGIGNYPKAIRNGTEEIKNFSNGDSADPGTILKARKALDKQIASIQSQMTTAPRGAQSALQDQLQSKYSLRETFNSVLDQLAPKLRQADALAAERFKVSPFRDLTLPGKINLFSPEGILRAVPGVPSAVGLGVSGAGALAKGAGAAINEAPTVGATIGSILSEEKARQYLSQANGDTQKARQMAIQDGYEIPQ